MVDQKSLELIEKIESWLTVSVGACSSELDSEKGIVLSINHKYFGPVDENKLSELVQTFPQALTLVLWRANEMLPWSMLAEHPKFNRRDKNGPNQQGLLNSDEFYVLKNGIKDGPYKFEDVEVLMNNKMLNYTDLISLDGGSHWVHVYQLERFDRRDQDLENLPHLPGLEVFEESEIEAHQNKHERVIDEEISAMNQLIQPPPPKSNLKELKENIMTNKKPMIAAIASVVVIVAFFSFGKKVQEERGPSSIKQQIEKTVRDSMRESQEFESDEPKAKSKRAFERRPPTREKKSSRESFTESNAYKNVRDQLGESRDNMPEEYDDPTPYEYDPVQSQVSKETLDRFEEKDETIEDIDRAPASDDSAPWPGAEDTSTTNNENQEIAPEEGEVIDF